MIVNQLKKIRTGLMNGASDRRKWTQEELAKRVSVTSRTIIAIEKGIYNPTLELAFRLALELGVSVEEIFSYRKDEHEE